MSFLFLDLSLELLSCMGRDMPILQILLNIWSTISLEQGLASIFQKGLDRTYFGL